MSVYLFDSTHVLLNGGNVATDAACCCATTGACCFEDGTCVVESEAECAMDGGTYLGNGVPCDPNPCCPCGTCGFPEFIFTDGTYYLTKTYHFVRIAHGASGHPTCDLSCDLTTVKFITINPDCSCYMDTRCSGGCNVTVEGEPDCDGPWTYTETHAHDDAAGYAGGCMELCENCMAGTCEFVGLTPTSATEASSSCDYSDEFGNTVHLEITATLSDPAPCI